MRCNNDINEFVKVIASQGLVILPTDTIYGFSCLPTSIHAIDRIKSIKKRSDKPFIILDTDMKRMRSYFKYAFADKVVREMINDKVWPGKVTVIAEKCAKIDYPFLSDINTIAVRWPDNDLINELNTKLNSGIISTSINNSGEKEINSLSEIKHNYHDKVDHIWEDNSECNIPSLIIRIDSEYKKLVVVRDPGTTESKEILFKLDNIINRCR
ncbi:MAG: Sua5/YciO/YrdC/YwlC family protein [Candidatus Delongbacteria bacterium]|nr:Sua5/YciO/YrdC/YwlC family protein [Candidatus Delongbacteria bacterium]